MTGCGWSALIVGAALGLGCRAVVTTPAQGAPNIATESTQKTVVRASEAGSKTEPSDQSSSAAREVARALSYVSGLRELSALSAVKAQVISRDRMLDFVERDLDTQVPRAVVTASGEILFALGTVPATFDYRRGLLEVMRAELLGFYEPHEKTMFVGADLHGQELNATLWHELVHALQDQHYDLEKLLTFADDASDWQSAVHALAEGDATSAMLDALLAGKGRAPDLPDSVLDLESALATGSELEVPAIIKRSVVAPYLDGLSFVNALRRRGGWAAVDAAWQRLPISTEQILHLDKYDAGEAAVRLPQLSAPSPGPVQQTYSDVYGEETLRILFEEWLPARAAHEAAEGWGGDRISVFSEGGLTAVGWTIRYDTEPAAVRALNAFARGILTPEGQRVDGRGHLSEFVSAADAKRASRTGQVCRERHTRGPFAVRRRGIDLAVTVGPFRRNSSGASAEGDCSAALHWATVLLTQLRASH